MHEMENPSFKLVFGFALGTIGMAVTIIIAGANLPGGRTLDFILTQGGVVDIFSQYSAEDIQLHKWVSSRFDMVFPFIYGAFFYFAAKRYANAPWVYLLVFWVAVGMIFDFTENVAQLNILSGENEFALKTVFTRAKFVFLAIPIFYCSYKLIIDTLSGKKRRSV
jgi:hypothetical protein